MAEKEKQKSVLIIGKLQTDHANLCCVLIHASQAQE